MPITTAIAALLVPAEVRAHENGRLLDALRLRWHAFIPRPAPEQPSRPW
jgi:hypothetical protein